MTEYKLSVAMCNTSTYCLYVSVKASTSQADFFSTELHKGIDIKYYLVFSFSSCCIDIFANSGNTH